MVSPNMIKRDPLINEREAQHFVGSVHRLFEAFLLSRAIAQKG